ncbi:hypothetical protein N665_0090s0023 [Sinapis alba]|nr:hypothetical protein N665_0090s0023 [Sinapis alba]
MTSRVALHPDKFQELRDLKLGIFLKFKELNFAWASRLVHFMLCFKLHIKKKCEVTEETTVFWQLLGVGIDVGPTTEQIIAACKRCVQWSQGDQMRLGYLVIFIGFIEGKKFSTVTRATLARPVMDLEEFENYPWGIVAFKVLMNSLWNKDLTKSYTIDGFIQAIQVWVYYSLPEFGAEYGHPV